MNYQEQRIIKQAYDNVVAVQGPQEMLFQHAVLCQVYLPYRDPGDEQRNWIKQQGKAYFAIRATEVFNPKTSQFDTFLGLPFGPKARLILTHINTLALQQQTPNIEIADSLTAFVKSIGLSNNGYQLQAIKNQLGRLAASTLSIAFNPEEQRTFQVDSKIIKGFDLWFPKSPNQRVIWDSYVTLSDDYFNSLLNHAVPLDRSHLATLSNNAMALDIYSWLAQRLHRVAPGKKDFIHWQGLKDQFGEGFARMDHFKESFRSNLRLVLTQYNQAKIDEETNKGFNLNHSMPPVPPKTQPIPRLPGKEN